MSDYTPKLDDCRSRLLDAEALLHYLSKPEYLGYLLEACSPEVTIGALVEKAWHLVGEASGDCEAMCGAHNEEVRAEIRSIAADYVSCQREHQKPGNYIQHIYTIDEIYEQSRSMVLMLMANLRQASENGEVVSNSVLESYASQLQSSMSRAIEASCALS